jgi:hypothetical protein
MAFLDPRYTSIYESTFGLVFFATPHRGSSSASLGSVAASVAKRVLRNPDNTFLEALKVDSLYSDELIENFRGRLSRYRILSFYESKPYLGHKIVSKSQKSFLHMLIVKIVDKNSATLGLPSEQESQIGLDADHSGICRFETVNDMFEQVIGNIQEMIQEAVAKSIETTESQSASRSGPSSQMLLQYPAVSAGVNNALQEDNSHATMEGIIRHRT